MNCRLASFSRFFASSHLDTLILAMFAVAAWMATHPYQGIWHDGVLYAGQAIFRLDPALFAKDLFFAYGSQDGFTAFTGIYALAIRELGLPAASALLLGMAHVAWVASVAWLLRGLLSGLAFWQALILVTVLPATYGSLGVFAYGEPFLTARIWAEPPALLAVACIVRGYRVAAIASLAFAAAMHPVIAFPAALFVFFFGFRGRQQWAIVAAGGVVLATLCASGIPPFANLTQTMDPLWLDLSAARSPWVFLDHWSAIEYREPLFLALLLTTAALLSVRDSRRLWWSVLGVFLVGMGLAFLAVYWPAVPLVQMQPWRVLWLVKILAIAAAIVLLQDNWSVSPFSRMLLGGLAACALTLDSTGLFCAAPLFMLLVIRHRLALEPRLPPWLSPLIWGVIVVVIGEKVFWEVLLSSPVLDFTGPLFANLSLANRVLIIAQQSDWLVFAPLLLGAWCLLHHRPRSRRWLFLLSATFMVFFAAYWQAGSRNQVVKDPLRETAYAELAHLIQAQHLTYWGDGLPTLWLNLHRGSYASPQQAAGIIFSRQTAINAGADAPAALAITLVCRAATLWFAVLLGAISWLALECGSFPVHA
ncbi:membrane hypothetical protein [Candidatus Accumulibacter aalborgensis]|uniref:Transmembrane protein n=1 Tax=Candidatus Accumulibacter aalborgensis TaxID=1860102 RepID=A0A1A8XE77_9PROT|nr:hypothetical protein [Candidatus Accumulibacter aalborgensis]SBT03475.1 membrane hypothetical protein [Candidatus Accumulibacter aalborgensis]